MKTQIRVKDAMTMHPITISVKKSLEDCAKLMRKRHIGGVLVVNGKKLVGIVTEQDIIYKVIAKGKSALDIDLSVVMETELITIGPDIDIYEAMMLMRDEDIRHLPILENDKLVGIITSKDILRIEPQLFDFIVAKFELREQEQKPLFRGDTGICELCGKLTDKIYDVKGSKVCKGCKKLV